MHVQVFRRTGKPCYACGTEIKRTVVGGRSTHFCPKCQPKARKRRLVVTDEAQILTALGYTPDTPAQWEPLGESPWSPLVLVIRGESAARSDRPRTRRAGCGAEPRGGLRSPYQRRVPVHAATPRHRWERYHRGDRRRHDRHAVGPASRVCRSRGIRAGGLAPSAVARGPRLGTHAARPLPGRGGATAPPRVLGGGARTGSRGAPRGTRLSLASPFGFAHRNAIAANVFLAPGRAWLTDFSAAGFGPHYFDVAAFLLTSGIEAPGRRALAATYARHREVAPDTAADMVDLLGILWGIGWLLELAAPPDHQPRRRLGNRCAEAGFVPRRTRHAPGRRRLACGCGHPPRALAGPLAGSTSLGPPATMPAMTSPAAIYPGNMAELDFVEAYAKSALRKPQMAADAALRTLVFSDSGDRAILVGLIAQELAEACRRLVAVYQALSDRTHSVARSLLRPLPGQADWLAFVQRAATISPEQMLRELSIGNDALEAAQLLRSQPELGELAGLVGAAETGNPMLLIPDLARRHIAEEVLARRCGRGRRTSRIQLRQLRRRRNDAGRYHGRHLHNRPGLPSVVPERTARRRSHALRWQAGSPAQRTRSPMSPAFASGTSPTSATPPAAR